MNKLTNRLAAASILVVAGSAAAAVMTVDQLLVNTPHSIVASGSDPFGRIFLAGEIGPIEGEGAVDISLHLHFSFTEQTINGDSLGSVLTLQAQHESGLLELIGYRLSADLFDGADLVTSVDSDAYPPELGALISGEARALGVATASFKDDGAGAFETIGDHGDGMLELLFRWSGFDAGDELVIGLDDPPFGAVQYRNFIPAPGGATLLALATLGLSRRRRC